MCKQITQIYNCFLTNSYSNLLNRLQLKYTSTASIEAVQTAQAADQLYFCGAFCACDINFGSKENNTAVGVTLRPAVCHTVLARETLQQSNQIIPT